MREIDWQPNHRKLRQFALCGAIVLPLIAWWWDASPPLLASLLGLSVVSLLLAWVAPGYVRPVYLAATLAALPIGWLVGEALLILIYFGVFWPIGWMFRLIGRKPLAMKLDRAAESYWEEVRGEVPLSRYYRRY